MTTLERRYDIDWVRVIAIGLLLVYHVAIGFQPWGLMIGFITSEKPWTELWIPMGALNVWRIPLLFFVSGMGVHFAMRKRNIKELLLERATRILVPFIFGAIAIFPLSTYILQSYYDWPHTYTIHPGHLWFLGNIFCYVVLLSPVFYFLKSSRGEKASRLISRVLGHPAGLLIVAAAFIAEAIIIQPNPYELYSLTWHGFFLGLIAFFFGFCFVLADAPFWNMITKWRWLFLVAALSLFTYRAMQFMMKVPMPMLVIESECWIYSVLGFAYRYLRRPSCTLTYLSQAAYPIYITHMIFLYLGSSIVFRFNLAPFHQFAIVLLFTLTGCLLTYEYIIRRVRVIGMLFGLKSGQPARAQHTA